MVGKIAWPSDFEIAYAEYKEPLADWLIGNKYFKDRDEALDYAHEVMCSAYEATFSDNSMFFTWLIGIAKNLLLMDGRRKSRDNQLFLEKYYSNATANQRCLNDSEVEELARKVRESIEKLPDEENFVMTRTLEDEDDSEIGREIGQSVKRVQKIRFNAKRRLRKLLGNLYEDFFVT